MPTFVAMAVDAAIRRPPKQLPCQNSGVINPREFADELPNEDATSRGTNAHFALPNGKVRIRLCVTTLRTVPVARTSKSASLQSSFGEAKLVYITRTYANMPFTSPPGDGSFGIETFLRGPDIVVRLLATLLVPWTVLLSQVDADRWFVVPWLKWFWVSFDVLLCGTRVALSTRLKQHFATFVFGLVLFDASATLVQALCVDIAHVTSLLEAGILLIAICAPAIATLVLFNVRRRVIRSR